MTEIERMHEERITALDRRVDVLSQKIDDYIAESRRNADRQDARMAQLENRMDATNQRMDAMNQRIDNTIASIHNLTVASMAGIEAIAVAIIISLFK